MVKNISGIPLYDINEHQEAYYLWKELKLRGKTVIHVDAHSDMGDSVERKVDGSYDPNCGNYFLPSLRQKIVRDLWWINPFSVSRYCLHLVSDGDIPSISTERLGSLKFTNWDSEIYAKRVLTGDFFDEEEFPKVKDSYILDIDLDAFSCCSAIPKVQYPQANLIGKKKLHSAEKDYSPRISRVLETLSRLPRPEQIVIAKSQGKRNDVFINPMLVHPVRRELKRGLEKIFS